MHDFALWRPFPKAVLENLRVPQELLDDQTRLRALERTTTNSHQHTIHALMESTPMVAKLANNTFDGTKFKAALGRMKNTH